MNVKAFKGLIKEAVAEAIREELLAILSDSPQAVSKPSPLKENKTVSFTTNDIHETIDARAQLRAKMGAAFGFNTPAVSSYSGLELKVDPANDNPFTDFIMDAAANMSAQDKAGLKNLG
jgi:hypothetical protein